MLLQLKNTFKTQFSLILFPQFFQRVTSSLKFDVDYLFAASGAEKIQQSNSSLHLAAHTKQSKASSVKHQ